MTPELFRQARDLFQQAVELPPERRASFLDDRCAGNAALRAEVESLLSVTGPGGSLLEAARSEVRSLAGELSAPRDRIGPYTILGEIGRGGMGTVYLAERADRELPGRLAIKVVKRGMDSDFILARFRSERQILATLSHANIARLLDGGTTEDGVPYFVMEHVEGRHLLEYVDERRLGVAERIGLFRSVCDAVSYAHRNLVVHRDIKPANVLVLADGTPKLLDFGLAKVLDPVGDVAEPGEASTVAGQRMLTPGYASPEQIRGERVTTSTDVFSLGVVLYRLLTGIGPFPTEGRSTEEISRAVLEEAPRSTRASLGEELDTILAKALQKEPARRYASVEQLSEDLRRYLAGLPVLARRDTLVYRARKFVSRHRVAAGAAAVAALLLTATAGVALWQARRALQKEALARRRFAEVRQLTNATLFEFHDAIKELRGSTAARALLVKRGLLYLNVLAEEARGDRALQRELLAAYLKLASIQGDTFEGNLGDTEGARRSLAKADVILAELARSAPAGPDEARRVADDYLAIGVAHLGISEPAKSVAAFRKAAELLEGLGRGPRVSRDDRRRLALAHGRLGRALMEEGALAEALPPTLRSAELLERLVAESPQDQQDARRLAISHDQAGQLQREKEPAAALASHQKALALQLALVASQPENAQLKRELAWTHVDMADTLAAQRLFDRAQRSGREAAAIFESLAAADPSNLNDRTELANVLLTLGETSLSTGDLTAARAAFERARSAAAGVAERDPESTFAGPVLAAAHFGLGRADLGGGQRESGCQAVARSLALYRGLESRGRLHGIYRAGFEQARAEPRCR